MSKKVENITIEETRYINLCTDFGFKYIYEVEAHMVSFLNSLFDFELVVLDYQKTEIIGISKDDRRVIFDILCRFPDGKTVLVEMQNHKQDFFVDRTLFYVSRLLQKQGLDARKRIATERKEQRKLPVAQRKKIPNWNYEL
jgi:hypothetical protein